MRHFVSELQILLYDMDAREGTEVPGRPPHSLTVECQVLASSKIRTCLPGIFGQLSPFHLLYLDSHIIAPPPP